MTLPLACWNAFGRWFGITYVAAACTSSGLEEVCEDLLISGAHLVGARVVVDGVTGVLGVFAVRVVPIQRQDVMVATCQTTK